MSHVEGGRRNWSGKTRAGLTLHWPLRAVSLPVKEEFPVGLWKPVRTELVNRRECLSIERWITRSLPMQIF